MVEFRRAPTYDGSAKIVSKAATLARGSSRDLGEDRDGWDIESPSAIPAERLEGPPNTIVTDAA